MAPYTRSITRGIMALMGAQRRYATEPTAAVERVIPTSSLGVIDVSHVRRIAR